MSPEQVRQIITIASHDGLVFPWWSYIGAFLASLGGAYLGSYLKRKAEDRATQENFNNLRAQLRKTTQDTEEIKATLLRKSWLTQQQWAVREQHYMNLLLHLRRLQLSLEARSLCYMEPGSEHDEVIPESEHYQYLARAFSESHQAIRELIGPASIFLSDKSIKALKLMEEELWAAHEFSGCAAEYVEKSLGLVEAAQAAVLSEAKNELNHSLHDS